MGAACPAWRSPDILARTGAFLEPDTTADGRTAYPTSKSAAIYLAHEYARRLPAGINAAAYNPGHAGTGLARNAAPLPVHDAPDPAGDDPHTLRDQLLAA
ncbi:hypothetical protein [Streptomyces sp. NPDC048411]|uniref:hypothetical protein n=1 Tax=Streptomyces sp. NPDC048411 TaxID=3157206 RepID=UPI003456F7B3